MDITEELIRRVAHFCKIPTDQINHKQLKSAMSHVRRRTTEYYDALAEHGQLHGNIPEAMAIAIVYDSQ